MKHNDVAGFELVSECEEDEEVDDWLRKGALLHVTPVFGGWYVQALYVALAIGALGTTIHYIASGAEELNAFLQENGVPFELRWAVGIFPYAIATSVVKLLVARSLLHSDGFKKMLFGVFSPPGETTTTTTTTIEQQQQQQRNYPERHTSERLTQRKSEVSQSLGEIDSLEMIKDSAPKRIWRNMVFFPLAASACYAACTFLKIGQQPFFFLFLPWACSLPLSQVSNVLLLLVLDIAKIRVKALRSDLEAAMENAKIGNPISEGFFTNFLIEYETLDEELCQVFAVALNLMLITISQIGAIAYLASLFLFVDIEHYAFWGSVCVCTIAVCLCVILRQLYPIADVTSFCHGINSLRAWEDHSLHLRLLQMGKLHMSPGVSSEFIKAISVIEAHPIGVKFPVAGLIRVADIMSAAKVVATLAPIAISWVITRVNPHLT